MGTQFSKFWPCGENHVKSGETWSYSMHVGLLFADNNESFMHRCSVRTGMMRHSTAGEASIVESFLLPTYGTDPCTACVVANVHAGSKRLPLICYKHDFWEEISRFADTQSKQCDKAEKRDDDDKNWWGLVGAGGGYSTSQACSWFNASCFDIPKFGLKRKQTVVIG